jgi:transcription termination factor Rho
MGVVRHEFEATIAAADRGGAYVTVPPDVVAALGGRRRTPVVATFDGVEYRGSVVAMGRGMVIGVLKQIRTRLGKEPGDTLTVTLMVDDKPRRVDVPADLRAALADARLQSRFDALSYSHRREYLRWIEEAKRPATRQRRVEQTIARVGPSGGS